MPRSFLGVRSSPGRVVHGSFRVDGVHIPLIVAAGRSDGPTLVIHCAQHASEYSGSAMIPHLLAGLDVPAMKGTLLVVPLCNIPTITRLRLPQLYQRQIDSLKPDAGGVRENINRCWPGKPDGTWNDRLTYVLAHELFATADAVLDYHSCRTCDPNFTSYQHGHAASRDLALAFGFAVIDEAPDEGFFPGQCHRRVPLEIGTPTILVEMSPTNERVQMGSVAEALRGATNALKYLGIVKGKPALPPQQVIFHRGTETAALRAGQIGFGVGLLDPSGGHVVKKGQPLAELRSLKDFSVLERLTAPFAGGLGSCGPATHHVTLPGEELATVQKNVEVVRNRP